MVDVSLIRAAHPPSFFGKLPSALDFVRVHHDYAEAVQLDRWLTGSLQRLDARGLRWPDQPLRFVFVPSGGGSALIGALRLSRDRAGRTFPAAVFGAFEPVQELAALPLACESFLQQAEALLERCSMLSAADLRAAMTRLRVPEPVELRRARERLQRELAELPLSAFAANSFNADGQAALGAMQGLLAASLRGPSDLVFDCPARGLCDRAVWAQLAALGLRRAPSCLWSAERMLLALGPLPERAPLYWVAPERKHPQLRALAGLTPANLAAVSGERSILHCFAALASSDMKSRT